MRFSLQTIYILLLIRLLMKRQSSDTQVVTISTVEVYDVTSYMDEHPGGDDVLLAVTGKDATDEFEDAWHSKDARELMEKYFIGELDEASIREIPELKIYKKEQPQDSVQKLVDLTKQYWVVPVSIIIISVAVSVLISRKK